MSLRDARLKDLGDKLDQEDPQEEKQPTKKVDSKSRGRRITNKGKKK